MIAFDSGADLPANTEIFIQIEGARILNPSAGNINVVRYDEEHGSRESCTATLSNLYFQWPVVRDGVTYDLGTGSGSESGIEIHYSKKSTFKYDFIKLWAVPMDSYESRVTELRNNSLQNALPSGRHGRFSAHIVLHDRDFHEK